MMVSGDRRHLIVVVVRIGGGWSHTHIHCLVVVFFSPK